MSRHFTQKLSIGELAQRVIDTWKKTEYFTDMFDDNAGEEGFPTSADNISDPARFCERYLGFEVKHLSSRVHKDLSKVEFDTENTYVDSSDRTIRDPVGFRVADNGLAYLGVLAGGDWETPLYFILYHDGKELRGYVPEAGNPWNTTTKQAYGNDDDADRANILLRGLPKDQYDRVEQDYALIAQDIVKRIVYKPTLADGRAFNM